MTEATEHMHMEFHSRIGLPAMFYLNQFAHFFEVPLSFLKNVYLFIFAALGHSCSVHDL